ncbi:Cytochrome P450 [Macleaya cordata]|uniref:Cytochrome P450 n=1 Tax=Macleaya cordata TaxID=56857 RepID=A0A200R828_MACCD|nr:Cytochrome P450 [Macleaya cordata]
MLGSFSASDFFPEVGWIIDMVTGLHGRLEKSFHDFDAFYQGVIDQHLDPETLKSKHEDIIDVLLKLEEDQFGAIRLSKDHIKAILMDIFLAGVDTSAITINWAMTELVRNPEVMKKVQEEIRSYVGKKGKVEEADLDQLQYLKMVVKETLRLHPPLPLLIPRESMQHSKINGYDIHPKTRVLINVWAIGRNPDYWEKPDEFYPERFIDSSTDFRGQNFEFLPFGGGRRGCPGINMGIALTVGSGYVYPSGAVSYPHPHPHPHPPPQPQPQPQPQPHPYPQPQQPQPQQHPPRQGFY